ncbi:MAG: phosphatase [Gemmatimonadetes bacterium]|nr:phosphatase [Gemmatimonadota bacterium]
MPHSRRSFLKTAGAVSLGFSGLHRLISAGDALAAHHVTGYGPPVRDPGKLLDLPKGFSYKAFSLTGELMDDGLYVPAAHDGMATFEGPEGKTIIVRNHEVSPRHMGEKGGPLGEKQEKLKDVAIDRFYDRGKGGAYCAGGTSTLVYDTKKQELERHYLSLIGTIRNCAGGPTPWNTWVTCEETTARAGEETSVDHGYNFEIPATVDGGLADPIPLKAMGRFNHEAIAVDPKSGCVYQTEDNGEGLLYRFIPDVPGQLAKGGKLQALGARDTLRLDTRNFEDHVSVPVEHRIAVTWIDIDNVESPNDDLRFQGWGKGAARFTRGEGMWYGNDAVYFACTNGGRGQHGQIWKYVPSPFEGTSEEEKDPGRLELFVEPDDKAVIDRADNLVVAPWGDIYICEDGSEGDNLVGVTPEGEIFRFAENNYSTSELAGATFSPDGSTMFVNIQSPGITLAITGPWRG